MAQSINDIDRSLGRLLELHDIFEPVHPEYAKLLTAIAQTLMFARKMMIQFWAKAWRTVPKDFDVYRGK